jgi:hypothetical protein
MAAETDPHQPGEAGVLPSGGFGHEIVPGSADRGHADVAVRDARVFDWLDRYLAA